MQSEVWLISYSHTINSSYNRTRSPGKWEVCVTLLLFSHSYIHLLPLPLFLGISYQENQLSKNLDQAKEKRQNGCAWSWASTWAPVSFALKKLTSLHISSNNRVVKDLITQHPYLKLLYCMAYYCRPPREFRLAKIRVVYLEIWLPFLLAYKQRIDVT